MSLQTNISPTAVVAALMGVSAVALGEWLMLYSPTGGYGAGAGYQNFLYPSELRLQWGFFLAVLAAPVYGLAYHVIAVALRLSKRWHIAVVGLAVFGFSVGNVWLGTNAYVAFLVQAAAAGSDVNAALAFINQLSDPLLQIVRVVVVSLYLVTIVTILRGHTAYPRWVALLAPAVLTGMIFVLYMVVPMVGSILIPAALNIAHVVFMAVTAFYLHRSKTA